MAPRQTSRKGTSRVTEYRIWKQTAELSLLRRRMRIHYHLRSCCWARMLVRRVEREMPTRQAEPTALRRRLSLASGCSRLALCPGPSSCIAHASRSGCARAKASPLS